MKRVLLTVQCINVISGSDTHVLTIAKEFKKRGWEVDVFTLIYKGPMKEVFESNDINVIVYSNDIVFADKYDLIWGCHYPVLNYCLCVKKLKADHIIFNSLSPYAPVESLPMYYNDLTAILCNSNETMDTHLKNFGNIENISVFPNYAHKNYFEYELNKQNLKKIAVISNHIPNELNEAIVLLKEKNYELDVYGMQATQVFVDDILLKEYDLVISIGKTVNYALAMKVPVYCYDHFGGCGYFSVDTIEGEYLANFSGRFTNRKISSNEIVREIEEKYQENISNLDAFKEFATNTFCFETLFDNTLNSLNDSNKVKDDIVFSRNELEQNYIEYFMHANNLELINNDLTLIREDLIMQLQECNRKLAVSENDFRRLKKLRRYVGRLIRRK